MDVQAATKRLTAALRPRRPAPSPRRRPTLSFVAWTPIAGRSGEIAAALGGEAAVFYALGDAPRWVTPLRYALSLGQTAAYLALRRPRAVIVTNPPILPGLVAWAYGRLTRAPVLLDSHPGGFGLQGDALSARLQPVHRWLVPRVRAVLVTEAGLAERVAAWGGRAAIVHEAPPDWSPSPPRGGDEPFTVLFVSIFARDEPVEPVLAAARESPAIRVRITGDLARRPPGLEALAPPNVEWIGFLPAREYRQALAEADAVLVLTTEPTSVVRAGYEAVWSGRPLVVSDTPALREAFPEAVHVRNEAAAIAAGLREVAARLGDLHTRLPDARASQLERWQAQRSALAELIGAPA
jgi:glycosyltransferase involved in cell wall biosynthesis